MSKNNDFKVTIGMCVKNSEATIEEAVKSIICQDFPKEDMELIVVDGCSKDRTLSIIKGIISKTNMRSKVFCENKGLGNARRMIINSSRGQYVVWVDGDMILPECFVRVQVEYMERNPDVGIAKGKYGTYRGLKRESLVAILENTEFILNTAHEGETASKALGTSGCIYRVEAAKQAGNFDPNINGVGEDQDIENRIRKSGWRLCITSALFYEMRRQTWGSLWKEYFWHGRGANVILKKDKSVVNLYKMLPPIALFAELLRVPIAYKLTHRKAVLLLPLHYLFKRIAWFLGFSNASLQKSLKK